MGRRVQPEIKFAFLTIFSQHFCPELSEKQRKNDRGSPFKVDKNVRGNHLDCSDCHNMITVVKLPCQEMNPLSVKWPLL